MYLNELEKEYEKLWISGDRFQFGINVFCFANVCDSLNDIYELFVYDEENICRR